jgi:hypothetical protein
MGRGKAQTESGSTDDPNLQPTDHPRTVTFQVQMVQEVRMVHIHQIGPNHAGTSTFWIARLEFFGHIKE